MTHSTRPNIVFILTDQQTLRAMSAAGNRDLSTPAMDSIADGGVRFDNSYCASPVCGPSRAALMTGRMPHETGMNDNTGRFGDSHLTMGRIFRAAGYETAYTGKWHLNEGSFREPVDRNGFAFLPANWPPHGHFGAITDPPTTDAAVEFLRRRHERPFLLVVSLTNPHDICYDLLGDRIEPLEDGVAPALPANFPRDPDEPQFITDCRQRRHYGNEQNHTWYWTLDHWRSYLHRYYRLVEQVDEQVGRLLAELREQGLERDTLVIFTSDHGEGAAGHQWVVKLMLYEEPVSVPLALRWPGVIPAGQVDRMHLASGVDILPTICDFAGVPIPDSLAGISLKPIILDPTLPGREYVVSELQPDTKDPAKLGRMLRTRRYKYIAFSHGRNPEMLFDMEADRGEMRNLAHRAEMAPVLHEHRALLARWIISTGDHFPIAAVENAVNLRGGKSA
jgi:arylsulfatase A-like enzyme